MQLMINQTENRSSSPTGSPRSSPRPSPRPQNKREHSKSDTLLTVNYKEQNSVNKNDGSPSSQEGSISNKSLDITTSDLTPKSSDLSLSVSKDKKDPKNNKKKMSWFSSICPTYKSRVTEFKKIFHNLPETERLVVDYSCALQRDILVHGRLYVTQNYLCFYANIFSWETTVIIKWEEVASISKEKTALIIPNAIQIVTTTSEKYFFTSFATREKTYMMVFRVWQDVLMGRPMTSQVVLQWVRECYGNELGLTSEDYDDYNAPDVEVDKLSLESVECALKQEINTPDKQSEVMSISGSTTTTTTTTTSEDRNFDDDNSLNPAKRSSSPKRNLSSTNLPTDMSDTTESENEKQTKSDAKVQCSSCHEGRQLVNEVIPIHVDQLFTLLFTNSKFYLDFHAARKTTDLTQTPWTQNSTDNSKSRVVNSTVAINQTMGPKTAQVTETQVMLPCSKAGFLYAIDVDTVNGGIPYGDSFNIVVHYCLQKLSENESSLLVFAQIKYRKSVWGLVKGMIEKNCWLGLEDFYSALLKSLHTECEEFVPDIKRKSRRKRRIHSMPRSGVEDNRSLLSGANRISSGGVFNSDISTLIVFIVLILLVILNVLLYFKLWSLEESSSPYTVVDLHVLKEPPKSHDEWIKLLQHQETLHTIEIQKWQKILKSAIKSLKESEESLIELQRSLGPTYTSKVSSVLETTKENYENSKSTEL